MARRRPLHAYPSQMYELFEKAQTADVTLTFDTGKRAQSFRVELYNLRTTIRETLATDPTQTILAEHLILMDNIEIVRNGHDLTLRRKRSAYTEIMENAIVSST